MSPHSMKPHGLCSALLSGELPAAQRNAGDVVSSSTLGAADAVVEINV